MDPKGKIEEVKQKYYDGVISEVDGVSVSYENWRFNIRISNTEPLLRLNVETKNDKALLDQKTEELLDFIRQ